MSNREHDIEAERDDLIAALAEIEELAEDEESAPEWVRERISDIAQEALKGDPNNDRTTNPNRNNR